VHHPAAPDHDRLGQFHNELCMQSGAYQNSTWVVGIAKAGVEEGVAMIAGSCIIAPNGEIVARSASEGDEVIVARCDLALGQSYRDTTFNFALHRRTEHYGMIVERTGAKPP
jgi:predicted amidohydrolase